MNKDYYTGERRAGQRTKKKGLDDGIHIVPVPVLICGTRRSAVLLGALRAQWDRQVRAHVLLQQEENQCSLWSKTEQVMVQTVKTEYHDPRLDENQ